MTHDELLAKINAWEYSDYQAMGTSAEWPYKVIRAVVELHKPIHHEYPNGNSETECAHCNDGCWGCQEWSNCGNDCKCKCHQAGHDYPCPTIQKIMDELK